MTPEKNCWGARAVKVPTVSGVQESLQTMPIVLPSKKSKNKGPVFYGADDAWKFRCRRGLAIIWGLGLPAGAIPDPVYSEFLEDKITGFMGISVKTNGKIKLCMKNLCLVIYILKRTVLQLVM